LGLSLLVGACQSSPSSSAGDATAVEYGDPVGIQLVPANHALACDAVIAVTRGVDVDALVPALTALLHELVRACPETVTSSSAMTLVAFSVEAGAVRSPSTGASDQGACITEALRDRTLDVKSSFRVLTQLGPARRRTLGGTSPATR
jgi:hypothetical protein